MKKFKKIITRFNKSSHYSKMRAGVHINKEGNPNNARDSQPLSAMTQI
jgi:uncharacterized protein YigE (DUF2233 family)